MENLVQLTHTITLFIKAEEAYQWLVGNIKTQEDLYNKIKHNTSQEEILIELIHKFEMQAISRHGIDLVNKYASQKEKLELLNLTIPRIEGLLTINQYLIEVDNLKTRTTVLNNVLEEESKLDNLYHLQTCHQCGGSGVERLI